MIGPLYLTICSSWSFPLDPFLLIHSSWSIPLDPFLLIGSSWSILFDLFLLIPSSWSIALNLYLMNYSSKTIPLDSFLLIHYSLSVPLKPILYSINNKLISPKTHPFHQKVNGYFKNESISPRDSSVPSIVKTLIRSLHLKSIFNNAYISGSNGN